MKVVCIEPFIGKSVLTYGKIYDVIDEYYDDRGIKNSKFNIPQMYLNILNDLGVEHRYKKSRFITLEEWREKQVYEDESSLC